MHKVLIFKTLHVMSKKSVVSSFDGFPSDRKLKCLVSSFSFEYSDPIFNFSGVADVFLRERSLVFYVDSDWSQLKCGVPYALKTVRSRLVSVFSCFSSYKIQIVVCYEVH